MRVLIAGVAGSMGRLVAERLLADPGVESVTGLDARACYPPLEGLRFVRVALARPEWTPLLDGVDAAIWLTGVAYPPRYRDRGAEAAFVRDSKHFVGATLAAGVPKLIVANSAALYGPQPPGPVTEMTPVRGHQGSAYAYARALVSDYLEVVAQGRYDGVLTRLRAAPVCGPGHTTLARYLAGGPVVACGCAERMLQLVHERDLVEAVALALHRDLPGAYNVCADEGLAFREVAALVGSARHCVPLVWLALRAWWGWRWRGQRTPPGWVMGLYRSGVLDAGKLRAGGWSPRQSSRAALAEALAVLRAAA